MNKSLDDDATTAQRALRLYQKLLLDGRRHFQTDLAEYLNCSVQTVMRLITEIEGVIGANLVTGLEKHRRWYQIRSISRNMLGLDFEELRYLSVCRDLAAPYLSEEVKSRIDNSIFNFSMLMADREFAEREKLQKRWISCCAKGWIDYTPYFGFLDKLTQAMEEKLICLVHYRSLANRTIKEHCFAPSRIIAMNNALYALGAVLTADFTEIRFMTNFAVHRIRDVILTDKKWNFQFQDEDMSTFGLPWHEPRKFRIRFNAGRVAEYVSERRWSGKQKIRKQPDGSIVLEMVSRSEPEVRAWVRSFGGEAELLDEGEE